MSLDLELLTQLLPSFRTRLGGEELRRYVSAHAQESPAREQAPAPRVERREPERRVTRRRPRAPRQKSEPAPPPAKPKQEPRPASGLLRTSAYEEELLRELEL